METGPLIASFDDGTRIYAQGISTSAGYFEVNVGIFNFSRTFNPNTGN